MKIGYKFDTKLFHKIIFNLFNYSSGKVPLTSPLAICWNKKIKKALEKIHLKINNLLQIL